MRIQELIADLVQKEAISIQQDIDLYEVSQFLAENSIGALPVVDAEKNIVGIISERDIIRAIANNKNEFFSTKVYEVMTRKVSTCALDDLAEDIYRVLCDNNIRHIPVVKYNKLLAMLSIRDFERVHKVTSKLSLTDEMTGLYNLRHCQSLLDGEFNQFRRFRSPFSVASIIIDDYEKLSEIEGFEALDKLLKKTGSLLEGATRSFDNLGRVDDDRFLIIFHNTDRKSAVRACDRIVQTVEDEITRQEGGSNFSVSIGLSIANEDDRSGEGVMKRADKLAHDAMAVHGNSLTIEELDNVSNITSIDRNDTGRAIA